MTITPFSCLMALLWFDLFIVALTVLRRRTVFLRRLGLTPLLCLAVTTVLRLCLAIEPGFVVVVGIDKVFPQIHRWVRSPISAARPDIPVWRLLLGIWLLISVLLVIRLAICYAAEKRRVDALPEDRSADTMKALSAATGGAGRVRVVTDKVSVPYIIGFFRPVIVVPEEACRMDELEHVFRHEWMHYLNRDAWIKLTAQLFCCLLWWNLPVYLLDRQLNAALELRCDRDVVRSLSKQRPEEYYSAILSVCNRFHGHGARPKAIYTSPLAMEDRADALLMQRFKLGLEHDKPGKGKRWASTGLIAATVVVFLTSYMFVLQPSSESPVVDEYGNDIYTQDEFAEMSYLVDNHDGTYDFYIDGQFYGVIEGLEEPLFSDLPIYNNKKIGGS